MERVSEGAVEAHADQANRNLATKRREEGAVAANEGRHERVKRGNP